MPTTQPRQAPTAQSVTSVPESRTQEQSRRLRRYLVTMVFWIVIMLASDVLIGLGSITLSPTVVAVIGWVYKGLVGAWLTCAFAALYRSTTTGAATTTSADATTP
mgnify:CR=1 FL=1